MPNRPVYWFEGMFLGPHHFQYADRQARLALKESEDWFHPFDWGVLSVEVQEEALKRYEVQLTGCQARFRDGTRLSIPEDSEVETTGLAEALEEALKRRPDVVVHLAIPALYTQEPNVEPEHEEGEARRSGPARYRRESLNVEDETDADNPREVVILRPRCRLLLAGQKVTGFQTLPLLRLRRSKEEGATPTLDPGYVPPLLAIDGWRPLWLRIQSLHAEVGAVIDDLAPQVADRELLFDGQNPSDAQRILFLSALNAGYSALQSFVKVKGLTPLDVYRELCRLVGQLSLFGPDRRPDDVPDYDHTNLGPCFDAVIRRIQSLLRPVGPRAFEREYFKRSVTAPPAPAAPTRPPRPGAAGSGQAEEAAEYLHVNLKPEWVQPNTGKAVYLGVEGKLSHEECYNLIRSLEMKLGSGRWAREAFRQGLPDLKLVPVRTFVPTLPSRGVVYFRVRREGPTWTEVRDTCTMGLQFNWERVTIEPDQETVRVAYRAESNESGEGRGRYGPPAAAETKVAGLKFAVYVTKDPEQ